MSKRFASERGWAHVQLSSGCNGCSLLFLLIEFVSSMDRARRNSKRQDGTQETSVCLPLQNNLHSWNFSLCISMLRTFIFFISNFMWSTATVLFLRSRPLYFATRNLPISIKFDSLNGLKLQGDTKYCITHLYSLYCGVAANEQHFEFRVPLISP